MRIIAGRFKGRALAALGKGDAAAHLRPTTDRTRESLFNVLGGGKFGDPIPDARVLDLFAGTGALGLEALSRGARWATFVEKGRVSENILARNVALCGVGEHIKITRRDATRLGANPDLPYDLVFLDPPYGKGLGEKAVLSAMSGGWLAPKALIVWEENALPAPPSGLRVLDSRRYGDTTITLLEQSAS